MIGYQMSPSMFHHVTRPSFFCPFLYAFLRFVYIFVPSCFHLLCFNSIPYLIISQQICSKCARTKFVADFYVPDQPVLKFCSRCRVRFIFIFLGFLFTFYYKFKKIVTIHVVFCKIKTPIPFCNQRGNLHVNV